MKTGLFALSLLALAACGGDDAEAEGAGGIDTKDVKGDIDLMGAKGNSLSYHHNGKDAVEAYKIELGDKAELMIFPDDQSFEEIKGELERKTESSFYEIEITASEKDFISWEEKKTPFGAEKKEEKTGYGFIRIVKKDDKMNYVLESSGETPLDPIWSKEDAEKLMKIAKSFVPKG